jgi:hypothetical protein
MAPSRRSSRNPDLRFFSSGPWQKKHLSERIGRTSRLNSIFAHRACRRRMHETTAAARATGNDESLGALKETNKVTVHQPNA